MKSQTLQKTNSGSVVKPTLSRVAFGIREVANALGVSGSFIRLEILRGRLKTVRLGRRILVTKASLDDYLAAGGMR